MTMEKEIGKGVLIGLIIPLMFLGLLYLFFFAFEKKITTDVLMSGILFGIGLNALVIRSFFKKDKDYLSRGVMISSFFYAIFWVLKFMV